MKEKITEEWFEVVNPFDNQNWTAAASAEEKSRRHDKKHGLMIERLVLKMESDHNEKIIAYSEKLNMMTDVEIENEYKMNFGKSHG